MILRIHDYDDLWLYDLWVLVFNIGDDLPFADLQPRSWFMAAWVMEGQGLVIVVFFTNGETRRKLENDL